VGVLNEIIKRNPFDKITKVWDFQTQADVDACTIYADGVKSLIDNPFPSNSTGSKVCQWTTHATNTNCRIGIPIRTPVGGASYLVALIAIPDGQTQALATIGVSTEDAVVPNSANVGYRNPANSGFDSGVWTEQILDLNETPFSSTLAEGQNHFLKHYIYIQLQTSKVFYIDSLYLVTPGPTPLLLTADDSPKSFHIGNDLRKEYNINFSHGVIPSLWARNTGDSVNFITDAELADYLQMGDELIVHHVINYDNEIASEGQEQGLINWIADIQSSIDEMQIFAQEVREGSISDSNGNVLTPDKADLIRFDCLIYAGGAFDAEFTTPALKGIGVKIARQIGDQQTNPRNDGYVISNEDSFLFEIRSNEPQASDSPPWDHSDILTHINTAISVKNSLIAEHYHNLLPGSTPPAANGQYNLEDFETDLTLYSTHKTNRVLKPVMMGEYLDLITIGTTGVEDNTVVKKIIQKNVN